MVTRGDGLIIAYVLSMVAALIASLIPLLKCYGLPHGWKPDLPAAWKTATRNAPLAAADTVEWASRRIDLAVLGAFVPASFVGIYYAAQQVATLPAKLKTSFEPVLGPAIVRRLAVDDRAGIAKQVRQVTYWIIAAQLGIALALGIPGRAVMIARDGDQLQRLARTFQPGEERSAGKLANDVLLGRRVGCAHPSPRSVRMLSA